VKPDHCGPAGQKSDPNGGIHRRAWFPIEVRGGIQHVQKIQRHAARIEEERRAKTKSPWDERCAFQLPGLSVREFGGERR